MEWELELQFSQKKLPNGNRNGNCDFLEISPFIPHSYSIHYQFYFWRFNIKILNTVYIWSFNFETWTWSRVLQNKFFTIHSKTLTLSFSNVPKCSTLQQFTVSARFYERSISILTVSWSFGTVSWPFVIFLKPETVRNTLVF